MTTDPIPEPEESERTNPGGRVSNADLLKAITDGEGRAVDRHRVLVDEIGLIKQTLASHDARLVRVERSAFPERALWAIALMLGIAVLANLWRAR